MNYTRTIDFRQIECFVACVQTGSISKAAELLHMAQPSVSKTIRQMEETLDVQLFKRYAKGIVLTPEGENIYQYAKQISEDLSAMRSVHEKNSFEVLRISNNPSSWFADTFFEFYRAHEDENLHYQVYAAGTREIVQRLESRVDDVGFVYVVKNQKADFQYYLNRNYLEFVLLAETCVMLYSGQEQKTDIGQEHGGVLSGLRLAQRFPDEFSPDNYWDIIDVNGNSVEKAETVVTTNSEYIMTRLLQSGGLSNISAAYLTPGKAEQERGIPLPGLKEDRILFGYIKRREEDLPEGIEKFVKFAEEKLRA